MNVNYDLSYDFREVKTLFVEEELSKEDLDEGLEPILYDIKVALTSHAIDRMYGTEDRDIEWEEIESLLLITGEELLNLRNGEEFTVLSKDSTISIIGNAHFQDGNLVLIVHTVIAVRRASGKRRKVIVEDIDKRIIAAI